MVTVHVFHCSSLSTLHCVHRCVMVTVHNRTSRKLCSVGARHAHQNKQRSSGAGRFFAQAPPPVLRGGGSATWAVQSPEKDTCKLSGGAVFTLMPPGWSQPLSEQELMHVAPFEGRLGMWCIQADRHTHER